MNGMIKLEMKYNGELELLNALNQLRKVATIRKISKPRHNETWDKVYIDLLFKK